MSDSFTHQQLVEIAVKWLRTSHQCAIAVREPRSLRTNEQPDAIGWKVGMSGDVPAGASILVECKTTRSDFERDAKKPFRADSRLGMGARRWYLVPRGILDEKSVPAGWGLAEVWWGQASRIPGLDETPVRVVRIRKKVQAQPFENTDDLRRTEALLLVSIVQSMAKKLKVDMNVFDPVVSEEEEAAVQLPEEQKEQDR